MPRSTRAERRPHHRPPTDAERDERFRVEGDPEDVLRALLGVAPEPPERGSDQA